MHQWRPFARFSSLSHQLFPSFRSHMAMFISACFLCVASHAWAQQITLAWDPVQAANLGGYRLYYGQSSRTYTGNVNVGLQTTHTLTGLTAGQTYYFAVTAYDTAGGNESPFSNEVSKAVTIVTPPDTTPPTIAITTPTSNPTYTASTTLLTLGGTAADTVGVTQVTWSNSLGGSGTAAGTTSWSAANITLQPGTNVLTVTARDAAGNTGKATLTVSYTTADTTAPTAPAGLTATAASSSQINLSWPASSDNVGVAGYRVERCQGASCSAFSQVATPTGTSFSNTGLTSNTTYRFRVRATDAAGNLSAYSPIASATTANVSLPPPVAAYAFNATSGTTALDATGNGNNGLLTNGARFTTGKYANGVRLDGGNDFVDLGNPASLGLTGSMTLSAWIYSTAFPVDDAAIISKRGSSDVGYQLDTTIDTGPRTLALKITDGNRVHVGQYGTTVLQVNTWYHVAGVYDATNRTMQVYVNGKLDNGAVIGTIPAAQFNSRRNVNIGQRPGHPGSFNFAGVIDNVRIYNRALSQAEIQADMNTPVQ